eukprot:UN02081
MIQFSNPFLFIWWGKIWGFALSRTIQTAQDDMGVLLNPGCKLKQTWVHIMGIRLALIGKRFNAMSSTSIQRRLLP